MRTVFEPSNALEGHMLQDLLRQRGIAARLDGAGLQGAVGELPTIGLVRLLVEDEDFAAARAVIEEWDKSAAPDPIPASRRQSLGALAGAVVGFVIGIGAAFVFFRAPVNRDGIDYNGDRVLDERWSYSQAGTPIQTEMDRNFDGKADLIWKFDYAGQLASGESDDDFNGTFESRSRFRDGQVYFSEVDTDGDSISDLKSFFNRGVLASEQYFAKGLETPVRVETFRLGKPVSADVDTDRDGTLDRRYTYDDVGNVASVEALAE